MTRFPLHQKTTAVTLLDEEYDDISNEDIEIALQGLVAKGFIKKEILESGTQYFAITEKGRKIVDEGSIIIEDFD